MLTFRIPTTREAKDELTLRSILWSPNIELATQPIIQQSKLTQVFREWATAASKCGFLNRAFDHLALGANPGAPGVNPAELMKNPGPRHPGPGSPGLRCGRFESGKVSGKPPK